MEYHQSSDRRCRYRSSQMDYSPIETVVLFFFSTHYCRLFIYTIFTTFWYSIYQLPLGHLTSSPRTTPAGQASLSPGAISPPLPTQYLNGEPVGYKVTYYPDGLESVINFVAVNLTNTTELTNLSAFTMYVVNVSVVSSGGVGPWNTIKARTDDAGTEETDRL